MGRTIAWAYASQSSSCKLMNCEVQVVTEAEYSNRQGNNEAREPANGPTIRFSILHV